MTTVELGLLGFGGNQTFENSDKCGQSCTRLNRNELLTATFAVANSVL